jgi:hypothetical protein
MQDFGAGIDQLSAENRLQDGYSESLVNMDPKPEGYLAKRVGYQGHGGFLPVRINKLEYESSDICFYLDGSVDVSSIDLSSIRSTPLIVYGRTSESHADGDWDNTDSVHYYPSFTTDVRRVFNTGTNTLTIPGTEHGQGSIVTVGLLESTSDTDNSNSLFFPDSVEITQSTADINIGYTNGTGSDFKGFAYVLDKQPVTGSVFVSSPTSIGTGIGTFTITAATHQLSNFNILVDVYEDTGSIYKKILPDSVTLTSSGTVAITMDNETGSPFNAIFILTATGVSNVVTGSVAAGSTMTVSISNISKSFINATCYLEQTIGGTKEIVIPDSVSVDSSTGTATISFQNGLSTDATFYVFYEYASININKICVTGSTVSSDYTDDSVQMTLWGLDHRAIYGSNPTVDRPGWVTHLDSYRSEGETRLVSGLGGNLFEMRTRDEVGTSYLLPRLYPNFRGRVASSTVIGPAFIDTADSSSRTRGYLQFLGGGEGFAQGTAVAWQSGNQVKYTLNCPNLVINGTLSTIISGTSGLEDYLTVNQAGYSINSGTFKIISASNPSTDIIELVVENPDRDSADYDETDAGMECGVFTDRVTFTATSSLINGDLISAEVFTDEASISVSSSSGSTVVLENVLTETTLVAGLLIVASRSTSVLPLRLLTDVESVENIIKGDMLTYDAIDRELKVLYINPNADLNVTIDGDGDAETATVTLSSGDTSGFTTGQTILLTQAGVYTGHREITDIPSSTTFTFSSTETSTGVSATLRGNTIQVDEELEIQDTVDASTPITVARRWIPIEAPDDTFDLTPHTTYRQLDSFAYSEQPILRSVMVANNLYVTNGDDEVLKYDGQNIYRAGLFRWQPSLFSTVDSSPSAPETGEIVINTPQATPTAVNDNIFTVPIGDESKFLADQIIRHSYTGGYNDYRVLKTFDDGVNGFVQVEAFVSTITLGASPLLKRVGVYKYYFRLNAIDANQNIIASAVTGADDTTIQLADTAQVRLRLIGMPAWDLYDYDKLEVEIYRTALDGVAPFYKLATIPMSFNNNDGYIDYIDTDSDDVLKDLDIVNTALLGQELGTTWTEPLRAKYITSASNGLVLGNIKDYPKLDIQLLDTGVRITASVLNGQVYTFRKDNTDAGTTTDMVNRALYEFRDSGSVSITPATDLVNNAGASFTVTSTAHGLGAGDWVYLYHASVADGNRLGYAGWWQINSATTDDFTILYNSDASYTPTSMDVDSYLTATAPENVPVWLGTDGNYATLNGNADTSLGYEFWALRRLANAINVSMRKTDITVSGQESFRPWMIANAGSEYNFGQMVITQPKAVGTFLELELPSFSGYNTFVNGIKRDSAASISAFTSVFPSRIIVSYNNYPEIMDNPTSILDTDSASAIDVNPADGQQITGIIPFFGDTAFGAALQGSVIVVFKTNSIYLVNPATKAAGQNPVQKIESQGLGCTAPYSIAPTKDGIIFANESGIYKLNRSLEVVYLGRRLERIWRSIVDRNQLDIMAGHYYINGNKYKLAVPYKTDTANNKVLVYDTTREYSPDGYRDGSWTTYDNHPAIGWANLQTDAFLASLLGEVFIIRNTGTLTDYRDDNAAISAEAELRAMDFGDGAIRKVLANVIIDYRVLTSTSGTTVEFAPDLTANYEPLDDFRLTEPTDSPDGLSDAGDVKIQPIRYSIDKRKIVYAQVKVSNSTKDEPVEIAGVSYRVAGMNQKGIIDAKHTTRG